MSFRKLTLIFLVSFSLSCGKDDPKPEEFKQADATVTIRNLEYPVVEIGTQLWLAVDYIGNEYGTLTPQSGNSRLNEGRYYTPSEANSIVLPTGWRIPTSADYQKLKVSSGSVASSLMFNGKWYHTTSNSTKLSLYPTLKRTSDNILHGRYMLKNGASYSFFSIEDKEGDSSYPKIVDYTGDVQGHYLSLRFVKDK